MKTAILQLNLPILYTGSMVNLLNVRQWILDKKLLHILFWGIYYLYIYFNLNNDIHYAYSHHVWKLALILLVSNSLGIYFVTNHLLPLFFASKRFIKFFIYSFITILISALFSEYLKNILIYSEFNSAHLFVFNYVVTLVDALFPYFIFLSIVIFKFGLDQQSKSYINDKANLNLEIQFLKSQMNPHLIFNALNSIYILMNEDKRKAQNVLMNFSDVLRYQIYDSSADKIELTTELDFVKKYIDLEKIRKDESLVVDVNFEIQSSSQIASLLLQPLIENAFKYVSHTKQKNFIQVNAVCDAHQFKFQVVNSVDDQLPKKQHLGIGLSNLKRRLALIYPNQHQLDVQQQANLYSITLIINIL